MQAGDASLLRRARPLLGTLVTIQVVVADGDHELAMRAIDAAFDEIATIHRCMSAHDAVSDLARLASAAAGEHVRVHPHTAAVLRLARHWQVASARAFDPEGAAQVLVREGKRPAVAASSAPGSLANSELDDVAVRVDGPLVLDLGGIAKGYAVDRAVDVLRSHGVGDGLVNAGGDLRAFGRRPWTIDLQHPVVWSRSRRLLRLRERAVASSVRGVAGTDFVATGRRTARWQCSTVTARDCVTADVLTKWALQAPANSVRLRAMLARTGARAWRA